MARQLISRSIVSLHTRNVRCRRQMIDDIFFQATPLALFGTKQKSSRVRCVPIRKWSCSNRLEILLGGMCHFGLPFVHTFLGRHVSAREACVWYLFYLGNTQHLTVSFCRHRTISVLASSGVKFEGPPQFLLIPRIRKGLVTSIGFAFEPEHP